MLTWIPVCPPGGPRDFRDEGGREGYALMTGAAVRETATLAGARSGRGSPARVRGGRLPYELASFGVEAVQAACRCGAMPVWTAVPRGRHRSQGVSGTVTQ